MPRIATWCAVVLVVAAAGSAAGREVPRAAAEAELGPRIDAVVTDALAATGVPSVSIAVVKDGRVAYAHAYGTARLDSKLPATPEMRYSVGSISKQFTAAAILLLAEEGRVSLDDRVVRWLPDLTRAGDVTVRQLLSMTSGYQDSWPQDYVMPMMLEPVTATAILDRWARKPLDFEPGTKWQYSNTNYVAAGLVVEKASGMPLIDFLKRRIFAPLDMTSVADTDTAPLGAGEPERYLRFALGPLRPAPKEGRGWMFAAGELAMTARDLAAWDVSMIDQTVLRPASYRQMETEVVLADGVGARYGLGVSVGTADGHRMISHGGEVSGFTAQNNVYPDDRAAVVVLANLDATNAASQIATRLGRLVLGVPDAAQAPSVELARRVFEALQRGRIDRSLFTANANAYFTDQALADFAASLAPLGAPREFTQQSESLRGGMSLRRYRAVFPKRTLRITTFAMPDGKLEQYTVAAGE
ncbi:MAG TPA: serine hydrolase domain-containing protein [Thermoanaerobaculaceae bacterium]|nr:serine hydrolase domain-containing protein [Thermoanaerobaculaceae bacterium]